jgi:rhodanese-related sulfurtransferase
MKDYKAWRKRWGISCARRAQVNEWDVETARKVLGKQTILLVDVREPDEFVQGHLPGAICIPRGILEGAADPGFRYRDERLCNARGATILLCCQSGGRSAMAAVVMLQMGFGSVYNLAGGIECWAAEGFALE